MAEKEQETIKQSEINPKFKREISEMPGGEKLMRCFQCGTCTSDCPIARHSDTYRPIQIIRMTQLGLRERVLRSDTLWLCAACFTCTDRCPQDVEVANVIRVLRNLASQEGYMPNVFKEEFTSILESGYAYRIPELRLKKREILGLPPLPKGNPASIKTTLERVRFLKQIEKEAEKHE
jgi:heterodisulfide reductase subunit C